MADILRAIFESKKKNFSEKEINKNIENFSNTSIFSKKFSENIKGREGLSVVAEIKIASPSHGEFNLKHSVPEIVRMYEEAGASAVSVVTEERYFKGSLEIFSEVRRSTKLPILRKDFFHHPLQIKETARIGAQAVLLIASILSAEEIERLSREASNLGIEVLLETHSKEEFSHGLSSQIPCVGINNRNLKTMTVDIKHSIDLFESEVNNKEKILVSESGIKDEKDMSRLRGKFDAVLIGTSFLEDENPGEKLRNLKKY